MPIAIREKRKVHFQKKIITPATIQRIATLVDNEANDIPDEENFILIYSLDAFDNSSYESQSKDIFAPGGLIEHKTVKQLFMRLQTVSNNRNIEVFFRHAQDAEDISYIQVSGDDSTWVNGVVSRLTEIVESSEEQTKIKEGTLSWLSLGLAVIFNVFYFRIFWHQIDHLTIAWLQLVLMVGVPFALLFAAILLKDMVQELWPDIELQTGPGYAQIPLRKRKRLNWIIAAIVMPIATAVLYDCLKNFLHIF